MYSELLSICQLPGAPRLRYARLLGLLRRICLEQSQDFKGDYATLFSRLLAVCQVLHIDHRPADRLRRNARRVLMEEYVPTKEEELADVADLAHFIMQVSGQPVPLALPQRIRPLRVKAPQPQPARCVRGVVTDILDLYAFRCRTDGADYEWKVTFYEDKDAPDEERQTTRYIYKGANVMLLDAQPVEGEADTLQVYMAVLEPDFLIDVSALTATYKPYGHSPLNYLLDRLAPNVSTKYILLGNLANQFMDDCIHTGDAENVYREALRKNYEHYLLDYACLPDEEVPPKFFEEARTQFDHIRESVRERFPAADVGLQRNELLLEPSFICPTLGLRGRLDVMSMDFHRVLELKSGKAEMRYGEPVGPKQDHLLQMSLYREILRRNFNISWNDLHSFLFYSAFPLFYNERPSAAAIRDALDVRNGIINLTHLLMQGRFEALLPLLTPEHLYTAYVSPKFYEKYLRPQIEAVTTPLQMLQDDELLRSYFSTFLTFIEREQFLSKTSDNRPDSIRGFAATWTADLRTKLMAGNILTNLRLTQKEKNELGGISTLHFALPDYGDDFVPNFNHGEMVQVYKAENAQANVTNRLLMRGTVIGISADTLTVELAFPQRNERLFEENTPYAVEHDASDSPSAQQVRNLFSLLASPTQRRDLLLDRRSPECDKSRTLVGEYPEAVSSIVLHAKQARDYYLLVGPPGTGKTNLALRSMVKEFLLTREAEGGAAYGSLLLTAYTNRAVDEICAMLDGLTKEMPFDYLRIGAKQTCAEVHHGHLLSERAAQYPNRQAARELIDGIPIVVGTVITLTNQQILFRRKHFAAAIIDEASQLLEPQALGLLCAANDGQCAIDKFILIGDHKQLPAVVMLPESQTCVTNEALRQIGLTDLRNSLFQRLHVLASRHDDGQFVGMLNHQGRMHPDISQFVSRYFYKDALYPVPLPHQMQPLAWSHAQGRWETFVARTRMGFVDVKPLPVVENLRANAPEAEAVCHLIEAICSLSVKNDVASFSPATSIGVIVPFRSQIASIRGALRSRGHQFADSMTIDTVECFQGSQRDYIIFSTTISVPYQLGLLSSVQQVGGTRVDRKLNVALTRARQQLFIVGNRPLLKQSPIYRALIAACQIMEAAQP